MKPERMLITGGAGFIGSYLAHHLLNAGHEIIIYDNLLRSGCKSNLSWLHKTHGEKSFRLVVPNLSDFDMLKQSTEGVDRIYHLAGQVAVTSSMINPRIDFECNALGTFNALDAARLMVNHHIFIYSSTNKVMVE